MNKRHMIIINEELKKLIEGNAVALATVGENGKPHCIAVADVRMVAENKILVGDNYMVETRDNIKKNAAVALAVWNRDWEEDCAGYELQGMAEYFSAGQWHEKVKQIHEGFPAKGAILITIEKIKKLA